MSKYNMQAMITYNFNIVCYLKLNQDLCYTHFNINKLNEARTYPMPTDQVIKPTSLSWNLCETMTRAISKQQCCI